MRTLIISDIHLGAPGRFPHSDGELCNLLQSEDWDQVVLLGDIFDLWVSSLAEIVVRYSTFFEVIEALECPVIYVPGNHDDAFKGLYSVNSMEIAWPDYTFEDNGKTIVLLHGDTYEESFWGKSMLGNLIVSFLDATASWIAGRGTSIRRYVYRSFVEHPMRESYAIPLMETIAAATDCDVLVVGHTHTPTMLKFGEKQILNSGSFGIEFMTYVVIRDGVPELCEIPT